MKSIFSMMGIGLIGLFILNGCGQPAPASLGLTAEECGTLEKKMVQTDRFIEQISAMDPSHVEEALAAMPRSEITTAITKPKMLKDAKHRKAKLEAEFAQAGCKKEM